MFTLDESMSFKDNELMPLIETRVNDLRKTSNAITCDSNRVGASVALSLSFFEIEVFLSSANAPLSIQVERSFP